VKEIGELKTELMKQREDHANELWEANSRSMHFRFDAMKGPGHQSVDDVDDDLARATMQ